MTFNKPHLNTHCPRFPNTSLKNHYDSQAKTQSKTHNFVDYNSLFATRIQFQRKHQFTFQLKTRLHAI